MLGTTSATAQSSLIIFAQKYIGKCEDTYFILQNKYLCIYKDSFGAKILRDDCACVVCLSNSSHLSKPQ